MSTQSGPRATYGTKKSNVPGVENRAQMMYNNITLNIAMFTALPMTMVAFLALITALTAAQQTARGTNAKGSSTVRNTKRNALWSAMGLLRAYVQSLADALDPEGATALIEAAGLLVATTTPRHKDVLSATLTTGGVVHLEAFVALLVGPADASKKALFNWQQSLDGKTWTDLHATPLGNTVVLGLTPLTTYQFRVSVTIGTVTGPWSQAVSIFVV
jgi:hypothetical protein